MSTATLPMSDRAKGTFRAARPPIWLLAAPALMFGYGVVRLIDGRDGEYGPGLAWTTGHLLFLASLLLFGVVAVRLRRLVSGTMGQEVTASVAMLLALAGVVAFVRVIIIDLVVGFRAADNPDMRVVRADIGNVPGVLPEAVWDLGPLPFVVGLVTLTVLLAIQHPRLLAAWSPVLIVIGFACIMVNLNLLPVGAALIGLALAPVAWRNARHSLPQ